MFKKIYITALVVGPALLFFGRPSITSDLYGDLAPQTYAAVNRLIPVGSSIDTAALKMKSQGFQCEARRKNKYAGYNGMGAPTSKVEYPASPILFCKATRWLPNLYQKSWVVILANDRSVVTNIAVSVDWDGF